MKKNIILILSFSFTTCIAQSHTINCININKLQNPEEYYDEYSSEGGYQNLTISKKKIKIDVLGSKDKDLKEIIIRIQTQSDGSQIMSDSENYNPEENEIALFLEDDDRKFMVGTSQKLFFKIGKKLKQSIISKKTKGLIILELIKCKMLNLKKIPIDDQMVESLENEIGK